VSARRGLWLLALLFALAWFSNLEFRKLVRPDEGRYAEIPREMVASGDWVTPRLNDLKYFEKPALQYWGTAAAYTLFGEHHWTARLWPALTGFLGVLAVAFVGMRLWGREAGLMAAAVLASSLFYGFIGHINTLDMGVTFFLTGGLFALMLAQQTPPAESAARRWMLVAWAMLGLAVLSKGLIGAALPCAALVVYSVVARDFAVWRRLCLGRGVLVLLLVTAPWFIWVSLRNPEFFRFFFIHEHFERFLTKVHSRYQPWWYFVPMLLAGLLPWTLLLPGALWRALRAERPRGYQPRVFLLVWSAFVFVFFSLSSSKLPSYILPIFPALALLMGEHVSRLSARTVALHALPYVALGAGLMLAGPQATRLADAEVPLALYQAYVPWLVVGAGTLAAGATQAAYFGMRERRLAAVLSLATGGFACGQLVLAGHDSLAPANSSYYLARQIAPHVKPETPFFSIGIYEQTLPFYLKRTVTLVEVRDELAFGIDQEPHKWIRDYAAFAAAWRAAPEALAIMHPNTIAWFDAERLPYEIIARDTRRLVVKKPSSANRVAPRQAKTLP
jgi:4-amino-4-deoxy-L-arabinose transferase-like glycosyltransferase